jgi:aryl-alcohol dehydrogenase-like predicted oxidoreductase
MEMKSKINYIGLSECSASTLRRAHKMSPITCIQMEYILWCRGIEKEVRATCKELGVGVVAYSPLGRGFFGGADKKELASDDYRKNHERFQQKQNHDMYDKIEEMAKTKNATPAQLMLAWVEAQQDLAVGVVAIPGTIKEKNLRSNAGSLKIELTKALAPDESTQANRYNDSVPTWETENTLS